MAAKTNAAVTCTDKCCNIIRNLNLVHIIRTPSDHYHYTDEKHYVYKNPYFNRKYSTEHVPEGNATFAVWAHNRFLAYHIVMIRHIAGLQISSPLESRRLDRLFMLELGSWNWV